jgi:hypothetical protein
VINQERNASFLLNLCNTFLHEMFKLNNADGEPISPAKLADEIVELSNSLAPKNAEDSEWMQSRAARIAELCQDRLAFFSGDNLFTCFVVSTLLADRDPSFARDNIKLVASLMDELRQLMQRLIHNAASSESSALREFVLGSVVSARNQTLIVPSVESESSQV